MSSRGVAIAAFRLPERTRAAARYVDGEPTASRPEGPLTAARGDGRPVAPPGTLATLESLLTGSELVDPGFVYLSEWRPETDAETTQRRAWGGLAGVARKV